MKKYSRVKAYVSLDAIAHNFAEMKKKLPKDSKMIAVIKADGYGHGAAAIAKMTETYDYLWGFATATAEESLELRACGIKKPILILGLIFEEYYEEMIEHDVRMTVSEWHSAKLISEAAVRLGKTAKIHLALDTGMSRIGFKDTKESVQVIQKIAALPNIEIEGLFTHFARADEMDRSPALVQLERYQRFSAWLMEAGVEIKIHHTANSAGIMRIPEAYLNVVRAGITIYGIYPSDEVEKELLDIRPAMELKSRISYIKNLEAGAAVSYGGTFVAEKEMRVATIPVGYADGYPRKLSNKGWVLIHGKKAPILGRVCMDQFMVDVSEIPEAKLGDEVTLMGRDGAEMLSVDTLGELSGRFPYEFVCCIAKRVPRIYIKDGKICGEESFFMS